MLRSEGDSGDLYVPDEVIVILKDSSFSDAIDDVSMQRKGIRGKILKKMRLSRSQKQMLRIKLEAGQTVQEVLDENWGSKDSRILRVEPNYRLFALGIPSDSSFNNQWSLNNYGQTGGTSDCDIDAPQAWDITSGLRDVVVAVIDTGVDYSHPDLAANMWVNSSELNGTPGVDDDGNGYVDDIYGYDFLQNDNDPYDENGHGTHCAGIIAAVGNNNQGVAGVSWRSRIMVCRFMDANGSGTVADAIEGIDYAVAMGVRILSNSWGGGGYSSALMTAIENAKNQGVLFVAAAGNAGTNNDSSPQYPANYSVSNVISVAATNHLDGLASFSCYGKQTVHIAAPGVNILSTVPGGYAWYSGTSMAAPHVSGVAALLLSMNPSMSLPELKDRLIWTGDSIAALQDTTITGRRLNAYNALAAEHALRVISPTGESQWSTGFRYTVSWSSIGAQSTVSLYLAKGGEILGTIAEHITNQSSYSWNIPEDLEPGNDYTIVIEDGIISGQSEAFTLSDERVDRYTEYFTETQNLFDLSNKSVLFVPVDGDSYRAIAQDIEKLPESSTTGKTLRLGDDDSILVPLTLSPVVFYGQSYTGIYVGSNGYITFGQTDQEYRPSLSTHFSKPRLSILFHDLNPAGGGTVSWKELNDRVIVTWRDVPTFTRGRPNTFQAELFYDGKIRLSWLDIPALKTVVGLSRGRGLEPDYLASDISDYASYSPRLELIAITGPTVLDENDSVQMRCVGYYEYDIIQELTSHENILWNCDTELSFMNPSGVLSAGGAELFRHVTASAEIDGRTDALGLFVRGQSTDEILIDGCSIKAGASTGLDSFSLIGRMSVPKETLRQADSIVVSLWSSGNALIRQNAYGITESCFNNDLFTVKQRFAANPGGLVHDLRIDTLRGLIRYSLKSADLRGLDCPSYITVECGSYGAVGQLHSGNVNKGKSIPALLMNGIGNTIQVSKIQLSNSQSAGQDKIDVAGQFSLHNAAMAAGDVVVGLNSQTFTFPAAYSTVGTGTQSYRYVDGSGQSLSAKLNFRQGTFKIKIQKADILCGTPKIDFGMMFDAFEASEKLDL
jgi:subtilisin family serine protease